MPRKTVSTSRRPAAAAGKTAAHDAKPRPRSFEKRLAELKVRLGEVADLEAASAVLSWDQATNMPRGGTASRGWQLATLDRLAHQKFTDPEVGKLLDALAPVLELRGLDDVDTALVRVARRDYDRAIKVPEALVARLSRHANAAYAAWTDARPANDFDAAVAHLETGVALGRELSRALGGGRHIMDPLIDRAEPGPACSTNFGRNS
jgi:carboxypeptidase Taq